ncbi:MAG: GGDEF domain-containing protein, partial [Acidobacteriota bacterium]
ALSTRGPRHACVVMIYGGELGRRFPLQGIVTVGRGSDNTIVLELDDVSRQHARFYALGDECFVSDLGSTNGTRVNGTRLASEYQLRNGDLIQVGGAIFKFLAGGNVEALYHEEIYRMTIVDGLTQVHNKRYFLDFLERELARAGRHGRCLSLILFDIDHFKKLNDTYGHLAGDFVLRRLAERVATEVRREDLFARYGGEEFAIVLTESSLDESERFAERIRTGIADSPFLFDGIPLQVTCSLGIASTDRPMDLLELIKQADGRLYRAKAEGRNRVVAD